MYGGLCPRILNPLFPVILVYVPAAAEPTAF